jgi:hypothetical protein
MVDTKEFLNKASVFTEKLEFILSNRVDFKLSEDQLRERLLLAHWSLIVELNKSILSLVRAKLYGGALALLRPIIEAQVRAHVVLEGSDEEVKRITTDTYRVDFKNIASRLDEAFHLEGYYQSFLPHASAVLHSLTHSGLRQLVRRFDGINLYPHYPDSDVIAVTFFSALAVSFVTTLVTYKFKLDAERKSSDDLLAEWCEWALAR